MDAAKAAINEKDTEHDIMTPPPRRSPSMASIKRKANG
jgi:hypothetical protein